MAEVLIISANATVDPHPVFPLGMTMVAEDLRKHGHSVTELDYLIEENFLQYLGGFLKTKQFDAIGLSLRNIDNCSFQETESYSDFYGEIVKEIREHTKIPIILGGSAFSLFPNELLQSTGGDYGITGEGEGIFAELIQNLQLGRPPANRILSSHRPLSGEEIASPKRQKNLTDFYLKNGGMLNIQTKRGCPFQCAYCSYPLLEGNFYRYRRPEQVADEIENIVNEFGADYYFIADSVFNDAKGHYLEIAEEIIKRKIKTPWMAYMKPQKFMPNEIETLKRAGLHAVEWGTDAASDRTLKGMGKSFSWSDVEESSRLFSEAEINCAHFIIFGGPEETEETVKEGLANIEMLNNSVVFASTGIRILPGTKIRERAIKEKIISGTENLLQPKFYFSPFVKFEYIDKMILESFGSRIDRIYPAGRDTDQVKHLHKLGFNGPIWDMILNPKSRRRKL